MANVHLQVVALNDAVKQKYANHNAYHRGDSGLDLFIVEDQMVPAGETAMIKLGIRCAAWSNDTNVSFLMMARSSIYKTPLRLCNCVGLIDAGYRGEMMAVVDNIKTYDYTVKKGDRLVQAVGFTGGNISFELVDSLSETSRGEGGFGSTTIQSAKKVEDEKVVKDEKAMKDGKVVKDEKVSRDAVTSTENSDTKCDAVTSTENSDTKCDAVTSTENSDRNITGVSGIANANKHDDNNDTGEQNIKRLNNENEDLMKVQLPETAGSDKTPDLDQQAAVNKRQRLSS